MPLLAPVTTAIGAAVTRNLSSRFVGGRNRPTVDGRPRVRGGTPPVPPRPVSAAVLHPQDLEDEPGNLGEEEGDGATAREVGLVEIGAGDAGVDAALVG